MTFDGRIMGVWFVGVLLCSVTLVCTLASVLTTTFYQKSRSLHPMACLSVGT